MPLIKSFNSIKDYQVSIDNIKEVPEYTFNSIKDYLLKLCEEEEIDISHFQFH